jgi:hypothetical protein
MEQRRRPAASAARSLGQPGQQRQQVQHAVGVQHMAALHGSAAPCCGQAFEQHRSLAFVGRDLGARPAAGGGVEPAAGAAGGRRLHCRGQASGHGAGGAAAGSAPRSRRRGPGRAARPPPGARARARLVAAGQRQRRRWPTAPGRSPSTAQQLAAPGAFVRPGRRRPAPDRAAGPQLPCSAATAAMWAWWCCTATNGRPRACAQAAAKRVACRSPGAGRGPRARLASRAGPAGAATVSSSAGRWRRCPGCRCAGEEGLVAACEADGVLQEGTGGQHRGPGVRQLDAAGRVPRRGG